MKTKHFFVKFIIERFHPRERFNGNILFQQFDKSVFSANVLKACRLINKRVDGDVGEGLKQRRAGVCNMFLPFS